MHIIIIFIQEYFYLGTCGCTQPYKGNKEKKTT